MLSLRDVQKTRSVQPGKVVLVNLLVLLVVLGGLELLFRMRHGGVAAGGLQMSRGLHDRFVAWRNRPLFSNGAIFINAQGFRHDKTVVVPKPPQTVRIFLLGGSAAFGDTGGYAEIDNPFPRIYNNQLIDHYLEAELNHAFPAVRWEVINAAAVGYRLYQELPLLQSSLLHYRPDYVVLMDGYNDVFQIQQAQDDYDPYAATPYDEEFEELANPRSIHGLFRMSSILLAQHSALFRTVQDHWHRLGGRMAVKHALAATPDFATVTLQDLSPAEQKQVERARREISYYSHTARQINRIVQLDGVTPLFLLQPVLILSHKPLTPGEQKLWATHRRVIGRASVYTFGELFSVLGNDMRDAAKQDGFRFEDLTGAFDHTSDQVFTDYCHLTPAANRIIADRIFATLKDSFAATAGQHQLSPAHALLPVQLHRAGKLL